MVKITSYIVAFALVTGTAESALLLHEGEATENRNYEVGTNVDDGSFLMARGKGKRGGAKRGGGGKKGNFNRGNQKRRDRDVDVDIDPDFDPNIGAAIVGGAVAANVVDTATPEYYCPDENQDGVCDNNVAQ